MVSGPHRLSQILTILNMNIENVVNHPCTLDDFMFCVINNFSCQFPVRCHDDFYIKDGTEITLVPFWKNNVSLCYQCDRFFSGRWVFFIIKILEC
jgi:hypothetical protein